MSYTQTVWSEAVTKVGPTNLNHLENGLQAAAAVADAAIPKPATPATNAGLVFNGTNWVAAKLVDNNIDPAANIAYSKLTLAGSIVNNDVAPGAAVAYSKLSLTGGIVNTDVAAAAAIALSKLADPGSGKVVTSAGAGAIAALPPGYEFDYKQITTNGTTTATTAATATAIITGNAVTYDGSTVVVIRFVTAELIKGTNAIHIDLWDSVGPTDLGVICGSGLSSLNGATGELRLTPAAGAHTYSIRAWVDAGTGTVTAGAGGASTSVPAFMRITKV